MDSMFAGICWFSDCAAKSNRMNYAGITTR